MATKNTDIWLSNGASIDESHVASSIRIPTIKAAKRNEADLEAVLEKISDICLKYNMRVGQLIENIKVTEKVEDLFFVSNERLISILDAFDKR